MKMQTFRKPHQWLNFWLEKYTETLSGLKVSAEVRKKYWVTLKQFLEELPGNPRNIALSAVEAFIAVCPEERLAAITIFYQQIAPSKPHLEMLKKLVPKTPAVTPIAGQDPVEQFRSILAGQKFSPRTVKNYCTSTAAFLKWLNAAVTASTPQKIEEYCRYLAEQKKLAPRTIALHRAALKLFCKKVVDAGTSGSVV
jgi:hypothetical protein